MLFQFDFISQNLNYALAWMVIHSLWQATLVAIIFGLLTILLNQKSPRLRYLLGNISLFSILTSAIITFLIYYNSSNENPTLFFSPESISLSNNGEVDNFNMANLNPAAVASENSTFSVVGLKDYLNRNIYFIVLFWAMGVVLFMLKLLGGISYIYYLRNRMNFVVDEYWTDLLEKLKKKTAFDKSVLLMESALVRTPMVIGHFKPMILFPIGAINRLEPHEVEAILAHELAHIMRKDYIFNIAQSVIEAIFYFHPAVWWISSQVRVERENCCDDMAIEICGSSMTYAKSLVSVQEMAYYSPTMAMSFAGNRRSQLVLRIQRIINQRPSKINILEKLASTLVILCILMCISFASSHQTNFHPIQKIGAISNIPNIDSFQKIQFLKYINQRGNLDSFPVSADIENGKYTFTESMYRAELTVKDQHVVAFSINGLEVDIKDFPKFEDMIQQILRPSPIVQDEIMAKQIQKENKRKLKNSETLSHRSAQEQYSTTDADIKNICQPSQLRAESNPLQYEELRKKGLEEQHYALQCQMKILHIQLAELAQSDMAKQELNQLTQELNLIKAHLAKSTNLKSLNELEQKAEELQEKIDDYDPREENETETESEMNGEFWRAAIEKELQGDNLLSKEGGTLELDANSMVFNSKKLSEPLHSKYQEIYENLTENDLEEVGLITLSFFPEGSAGYKSLESSSVNWDKNQNLIPGPNSKTKSPSMVSAYFQILLDDGLLKLNKEIQIEAGKTYLTINNKKLDNKLAKSILKRAAETSNNLIHSNFSFNVKFKGKVHSINKDALDVEGTFVSSVGN